MKRSICQLSMLWLGAVATTAAMAQPPAGEHTRPQLIVTRLTRPVEPGSLAGVSGRELRLPESMSEATVKVGLVAGVDFLDDQARHRLRKESHQQLVAARSLWLARARKELADWELAKRRTADIDIDPWGDELRLRIKLLESLPESCSDPGPIFDAVAVRGRCGPLFWIDTDRDGDLARISHTVKRPKSPFAA